MKQELAIWSRVVIAQLNSPRSINREVKNILDADLYSVEDVKVKIKELSWKRQGQAVETLLHLDLLFLLEDKNGIMKLANKEDSIRDRVPFDEFDCNADLLAKDKMISFNGEIRDLSWQVEINQNEIKMHFTFEYLLLATREQVVRLSEQSSNELENHDLSQKMEELKNEIARAQNEKLNLQHQMFLYEKDISSLKRGIRKVENRNSLLDKESKHYKEMLAQLQLAIRDKESRFNKNGQNRLPKQEVDYTPIDALRDQAGEPELSLGSRVKRLFLNSI
ncbi:MAG: hypothetical protein PHE26_10540 [Syntrophomonadaceae bacterium]|nr:hypothetical protein [Syntrophomonadaceae bacterium]